MVATATYLESQGHQAAGKAHFSGIPLQAHKLSEWLREIAFEDWGQILGNEEKNLHGVKLGIRWLAMSKFNGHNAERPNVGLVVVATLFDDFWRYPVRGAHERVFLRREDARELA